MNKLLKHYQLEVEFPDVSGFEHLQMLDIRDDLEEIKDNLSASERKALLEADRRLLEQALAFESQLAQITTLASERAQRQPPASHWWWYLDVITQLPPLVFEIRQQTKIVA